MKQPQSIFFFPNGQTAVCDEDGEQIPEYQGGHLRSIQKLKAAGIDWRNIPERVGAPQILEMKCSKNHTLVQNDCHVWYCPICSPKKILVPVLLVEEAIEILQKHTFSDDGENTNNDVASLLSKFLKLLEDSKTSPPHSSE